MRTLLPLLLLAFVPLLSCSTHDLQRTMDTVLGEGTPGLSNDEVIAGLKQALELGSERAVGRASVTDGYWKNARIRIPFPPEAEKVRSTLLDLGMTTVVEEFELTLNRAAEEAAKEAVPVFVEAVKGMTIADGFAILNGGEHAATVYLKEKTSAALMQRFTPVVARATDKVALASHWEPLASAYNTTTLFTGGTAVEPDLDAYVVQKATEGLFLLLSDEEARIRQDPLARTTELLQRVFR